MSKAPLLPIRATVSGRWQIPLLAVGLCVLVGGLYRVGAAHTPVGFEEKLGRVRALREAGALTRAHAYVLYLLKEPDLTVARRGELHRRLAATVHQAESGLDRHKPANLHAILSNYHTAVRHGVVFEGADWLALGDAYRWSDRREDAIDAFRQALRLSARRPDRIRRTLVELQTLPDRPLSAEGWADLEAILEDDGASATNYRWALDRKVAWLLGRGETEAALALVREGEERLVGSAERLALSYSQALCLRQAGRRGEAETLLRSLRNNWTARDELWGKAGWLLGRLHQEDDRPQAALSFYEDVLTSFQSGDLHDACELGRAECLVMLERYERSLEVFGGLIRHLTERRPGSGRVPPGSISLDRDALRTTITTVGETLLRSQQRRLGLQYLESALALVDASNVRLRSHYMSRVAAGLTEIALDKETADEDAPLDAEDEALLVQAAEMYLRLADVMALDEEDAARVLWLAAENFDTAGMTGRFIEVLSRFVREHKTDERRATALYRLGLAQQGVQDYPAAVRSFETVVKEYPRLPAALSSLVPLGQSLLSAGGEHVQQGVDLLLDIVDGSGPDPLFNPQASEYRDALIRLARYYVRTAEAGAPGHFEKAITRLEDAIGLYPDEPRLPRLRFLLAEAYRQSAQQILEDEEMRDVDAARTEAGRRWQMALHNYQAVKKALASQDAGSLTDLEQTHLRAAYLYVGDCLFNLNALEGAVEAYRETAWRYENEPTAAAATLQVAHCYTRLGRTEEARAALQRMQWLLKKMPDAAFDAESGMSTRAYWMTMADRLAQAKTY